MYYPRPWSIPAYLLSPYLSECSYMYMYTPAVNITAQSGRNLRRPSASGIYVDHLLLTDKEINMANVDWVRPSRRQRPVFYEVYINFAILTELQVKLHSPSSKKVVFITSKHRPLSQYNKSISEKIDYFVNIRSQDAKIMTTLGSGVCIVKFIKRVIKASIELDLG